MKYDTTLVRMRNGDHLKFETQNVKKDTLLHQI